MNVFFIIGSSVGGASEKPLIESRIEDGKLMYEKKWFLRGQPVFIEGRNISKFPAIISAIRTEAVSKIVLFILFWLYFISRWNWLSMTYLHCSFGLRRQPMAVKSE